ncbi:MAG TPA: flagellar basal body L-ring protein FlgH [Candidatus Rifleibacterium sp.]|nr:flagellar basal body L-ring protein FlgH [Candidatus Rifleibacterium sp.]HPT45181.1 flagellar basal body L-ring protein FlgH [Candidatus Rifleibacterium sp.]
MQRIKLLAMMTFIVLISLPANAASLWLSGNDLYSNRGGRDFNPGDIVTIVISEESNAQSKATTNTSKDSNTEISTAPRIPFFKNILNQFVGNQQLSNKFDGTGTTTRSGKLTGTITASVLEVLPNGNLLVEGSRSIMVNKENQIMRVRGVARPKDVDSTNSINSKLLADAQIKFDGRGSVGRANRQGLITKFFDVIF